MYQAILKNYKILLKKLTKLYNKSMAINISHNIISECEKRKYLPTFAELVDRLSILQLKEIFLKESKQEYQQEIQDILFDLNLILKINKINLQAETIRAIIILSQYNLHIWHNESNYRKGIKDGNNLELTHSLNGVRNRAKNMIQEIIGGRKDLKIDCLAAEHSAWEPSWQIKNTNQIK